MTVPILLNGEKCGTLEIRRDGAYTLFEARCERREELVRLWAFGEGGRGYLGVLQPEGEGLSLRRRLSRAAMRAFPQRIEYAGGETDATNVADATILEIFSSISADHMEFLGDTVEKIAAVKAGILKRGSIAVSAPQSPGVAAVLQSRANALGVPLTFADPARIREVCYGLTAQRVCYETAVSFGTKTRGGRLHDLTIGMGGNWQVTNAITALEAVEALRALGFALGEEALRQGFEEAFIGGRFEVVQTEPTVIMDGAHNPEAVLGLKASLAASFPPQTRFLFVMGVFADKDYREEIALMAPLARRIYTVQTKDNARALDADKLAQAVRKVNPNVVSVGDVPRALSMALAEAGKNDVILLFGSLSWLGEARAFFDGRFQS